MRAFLLLTAFNALFISGQSPSSWVQLTQAASEREKADDFAKAESLRREALRLAEEKLGLVDAQLIPLLANLAATLHIKGHDAEADPLVRRAYIIAEQTGDPKLIGVALNTLGVVLAGEGDPARAEPVLRRSLTLLEQAEGSESLDVAKAANNLATLYSDTHQYTKAEAVMARALPIYEKTLGPQDPSFAMALNNMFAILSQQHRADEGEPYLRRALAIGEKSFPQTLNMAHLQLCLAALEASHQNYRMAAQLVHQAIEIQERALGPQHPLVGHSLANYSAVLRRMHQKRPAKEAQMRANMILKSSLTNVK